MKERTRRALEDCIEKAEKLRRMKLDEHIAHTGRGFRANKTENDEWIMEFDLPDEKERDASLLTFRLFIQHNEDYSFPQMLQLILDQSLSNEFRTEIRIAHHAYYDYINGYPGNIESGFFEQGEHLARGEILNIVMNGGLAHTNDYEKRQKYQHWTRDGIRESVLLQEFSEIVSKILKFIYHVSDLCQEELSSQ
jgi:hypothetical protein